MARRGENIYKRKDGRWEGRYIKARKSTGQIKYGYVYHQTYSVVKQQIIYFKALYQQGKKEGKYIGTVKNRLESWLNLEVRKRVKDSTFASYQYKIQRYILPYIGEEDIQKISLDSLQKWIDILMEQGLSSATIRLIVQIFRMSFKSEQKNNVFWKDPTEGLLLPKVRKKRFVRFL